MPGSKPLVVRLGRLQQELQEQHRQGKHRPVLLGAEQTRPRRQGRKPQQPPRGCRAARNRHGRWVRLPRPVHLAQVPTHDERSWLSSTSCSPSALPPSEPNRPTSALVSAEETQAATALAQALAAVAVAERGATAAGEAVAAAEARAAAAEARATAAEARATAAEWALAEERAEAQRQQDQDTRLLQECQRAAEMAAQQVVAVVAHCTAAIAEEKAHCTTAIAEEKAATERWREIAMQALSND